MSERTSKSREHSKTQESLRRRPDKERLDTGPNQRSDETYKPYRLNEHEARREIASLNEELERESPLELISDEDRPEQDIRITRQDKQRAYNHTLKHVQRRLSGPSRGFSKIIHNPAVDSVSEALGKTVARPSGVLGAGLLAAAGLAVMTYFARRNGFALSGFELILFLAGGWLAGLAVEFIWRRTVKRP